MARKCCGGLSPATTPQTDLVPTRCVGDAIQKDRDDQHQQGNASNDAPASEAVRMLAVNVGMVTIMIHDRIQ